MTTQQEENWKKKAKERRAEAKALKKRVIEITESRNRWREKAQKERRGNEAKKKEKETIESNDTNMD